MELDAKIQAKENIFFLRKKIAEFIIDETLLKVGSSEYVWLWVAIEPWHKIILGFNISKERRIMLIAERFLSHIVKEYGQYPVSTNDEEPGIHHRLVSF